MRKIAPRRACSICNTVRLERLRQAPRVRDNARGLVSRTSGGVALIFRPLFTSTSLRGSREIGIRCVEAAPRGGSSRLTKGWGQLVREYKGVEREESARWYRRNTFGESLKRCPNLWGKDARDSPSFVYPAARVR